MDLPETIAFCGADCAVCPDYLAGKCPNCRKSIWPDGDPCPPIACCGARKIACCGECADFPCADMAAFYEESEGHRAAGARMRALWQKEDRGGSACGLLLRKQ